MKKILFPTDFSETANNALVYALRMAENQGATLFVLHAYEMPVISATANPVMVQDVYKSIELSNFENFKDQVPLIREIAKRHNLDHVPMHFILEEGFLNTIMKKRVKEEEIDLVVMGTNGNSGLDKKILGSNTANAIGSLGVPVLSIPHDAIFDGINSIAFTTLFSSQDKTTLETIVKMAKGFDATVKCIHVSNNKDKVDNAIINSWKENFKNDNVKFYIVENNDVEKAVFDFLDQENIDLLVSVKRNRTFFEKLFTSSMTKKLSYHNYVPVLAFHEE
ncbi:universal stress protein [Myroides marinus]|uniref:Nucleotide-binding universal stress protein, UspA family n=1 Tax=Myroides marinus TaxID=703342 RepID=A0A161S9A0_9FLAO|nr:universal stress protein [Myroides marinus]KZE76315.1 universal stress protein UspA [Myroides marinus]MDM1363909.1 universal stress protein [Myroides marinus]MDM1377749.1 universal stress protein [Myroides marinus]MDM1385047.1 universal stress protein [Myroides marinus]MDM1392233.1 universal stress protein [Myroides marinus]